MSDINFYVVCPSDGSIRIAVDQGEYEPPYMRSVAAFRAAEMGGLEWAATVAAVQATAEEDLDRDALGLKWSTRESADVAVKAAASVLDIAE